MEHLFIINPAAGIRDRSREYIERIKKVFSGLDEPYEIVLTKYPRHASEIAREHAQTGRPMRIYAVGGDGTLGETLSGCYGFDNAELAVWPCGTGNDFIKMFPGLPFDDLEALVHGTSKAIDILKYNDGVCINIVNCGFDANVAYNVRRFKRFMSGDLAYYASLFFSFLQRITFRCRVELDGELFHEGRTTIAVAANGRVYGGGFIAAPHADITDGMLDVAVARGMSRFSVTTFVGRYKSGRHEGLTKLLKTGRGRKLTVTSDRPFVMCADGETTVGYSCTAEVLPGALRFVLPRGENPCDGGEGPQKASAAR